MRDWSLMARAMDLKIPDDDLERIFQTLDNLEAVFRPLTAQLHPGVDTAVTYVAPPEQPK